jgi:hypothetical protein
MRRWVISFDTKDGNDYLRQLEALGATLAVPAGGAGKWLVIRDLSRRPAKPEPGDPSKLEGLFWLEESAGSLRSLAKALGLDRTPERVVVWLPRYVEDEMARKARAFAGRKEEDVGQTHFKFIRGDTGFELVVDWQSPR